MSCMIDEYHQPHLIVSRNRRRMIQVTRRFYTYNSIIYYCFHFFELREYILLLRMRYQNMNVPDSRSREIQRYFKIILSAKCKTGILLLSHISSFPSLVPHYKNKTERIRKM